MQKFKTVVEPKHKMLDLKLKETLSYRDLIFLFVKRDFVARYKQTLLGPLWVIIQPLLSTLINFLMFGIIAELGGFDVEGTREVPVYLFIMAGTTCWSYMSSTISSASNTFLSNAGIMGKVYYPRLVSPIASAFSNLINFGIQMLIFIVVAIIFALTGENSVAFTPWMLMFPVTLLQMMMFGVGLGLFLSAFTTKYRDITMLIGFALGLIGYLSPVNYGYYAISSKIPYEWMQNIYLLNPISDIVLMFKQSLFGVGIYSSIGGMVWVWYGISWAMTFIFLLLGIMLFNKTERTFMDTI
ncbi:MAG: ABC transporter permease [Clostridia bacterium]|nr:ABC transporter permease [Clostridia bacterium]